jgi:hypothetical protein
VGLTSSRPIAAQGLFVAQTWDAGRGIRPSREKVGKGTQADRARAEVVDAIEHVGFDRQGSGPRETAQAKSQPCDAVCPQRRQTWYKGPTPCPYRCPRPTATSKTTVYIRLVTTRQHTNAPSVTHKAGQTSSRSILMFVYAETPDSYQA